MSWRRRLPVAPARTHRLDGFDIGKARQRRQIQDVVEHCATTTCPGNGLEQQFLRVDIRCADRYPNHHWTTRCPVGARDERRRELDFRRMRPSPVVMTLDDQRHLSVTSAIVADNEAVMSEGDTP